MNILMIDEDNNFCEDLSKFLKNNGDMNVISITNNTLDAIENIKDYNKILELILLDLENINIDVDYIVDSAPKNCNVIAFFKTIETAKKHINNPYFQRIFQKPIAFSTFLNYINLQNGIENLEKAKKNILRILSDLGFNINHSGTIFLVEAVVFSKRNKIKKLSDIYTIIGCNHNTDPKIIGWSINNAIKKAVKSGNAHHINSFFKLQDTQKLGAKYIISFFSNYEFN